MIYLYNCLDSMYIPKIVKTKDEEYSLSYDNGSIIIFTFLEGKQISEFIKDNNGIYPEEIVESIAHEVRKIHDLTEGKTFELEQVNFANNLKRKSVIHFDLTKENIFVNNDKIGFIDFDDAKYGDSICDVAILLSFLFISKKRGIDNKSISLFLNNYYGESEEELKKEELKYIKLYIKDWVDYLLNNHEFDSSLKESFIFKKESIENIEF